MIKQPDDSLFEMLKNCTVERNHISIESIRNAVEQAPNTLGVPSQRYDGWRCTYETIALLMASDHEARLKLLGDVKSAQFMELLENANEAIRLSTREPDDAALIRVALTTARLDGEREVLF